MEKYTIIIPTKDRAETLGATLQTCLRQTYENYQIIVSDNNSSDETKKIVDFYNDGRISYIKSEKHLSMAGNFEFALGHVTDGFVMFLGADDGIMPGAIEYVDSIVQKYGVDAVSSRQAIYTWPDFPDKNTAGQLLFGGWRTDIEIRKSSAWIIKTLNFKVNYCFDLPNLYCGFVHKRIIDKAYKEGRYFRSITPDAYSAFATAVFIDHYAFSHLSFIIAGVSSKSNGASTMVPTVSSREGDKFYLDNDIELADGFVKCPAYGVVAAEAFAQVARAFPDLCRSYKINYKAMLNSAIENINSKTESEINEAIAIMAINFKVDIKASKNIKNIFKGKNFGDAIRAFFSIFVPSKVAMIPKSTEIGIRNIDDAALVAYVFQKYSRGTLFITNKGLIKKILRRLLGFG